MTDTITLTGLVATEPKNIFTSEGLAITSFRLASTQRRFDRSNQRWIDGDTNWYTVTSFRQLAMNVSTSIKKGQRAIVTGRLRIKEWDNGEKQGTNIDVEADAVGHDLTWGTANFIRSISSSSTAGGNAEPGDGTESAFDSTASLAGESEPDGSALRVAEPEAVPF